jgi:hypothetical protein
MAAILCMAAEGTGLPVSVLVTGANTPDAAVFWALLDDIPQDMDTRGWAALSTRQGLRRQRLRQPPLPWRPHAAKDRCADRSLWRRVIGSARPPSLEGGTLDRLAGRLPCSGSAG